MYSLQLTSSALSPQSLSVSQIHDLVRHLVMLGQANWSGWHSGRARKNFQDHIEIIVYIRFHQSLVEFIFSEVSFVD